MNRSDNSRVSALTTAALLTAARLFSLSLYMPHSGENAAITAVTAAGLCLLKLPLMTAAALLGRHFKESRAFSAVTAALSAIMIIVCANAFAEMTAETYPEHCTRPTTFIVLLCICAYVASMGLAGTARTASLILAGFAAVCTPVLIEMRGSMLSDRLDLLSYQPVREITLTAAGLLRLFPEPVILAGLIGGTEGSPDRAVKPFLIADALISGLFFLMCGTVMGRFFGQSGYAFYTLAGNTHGAFIDRANGIFTFFSSSFTMITVSALMLTFIRSVKALK
ncbi:MAG: hypothetical protein K6B74_06265 [Ruminococcus sp.]|nr:hypothetical protein [Ruminococcus sp.]